MNKLRRRLYKLLEHQNRRVRKMSLHLLDELKLKEYGFELPNKQRGSLRRKAYLVECLRFYSVNSKLEQSRVGSKGELFPPKKIRLKLGLKPKTRVIYRIREGVLVVEPIPQLEDVLKQSSALEVSIDELHDLRKELSKKAEA